MKQLHDMFRRPSLSIATTVAIVGNALMWLFLSDRLVPQTDSIPLHYNIYFGIDLVGPWWYLYGFAFVGLVVFLVNLALSIILYTRERIVAYFLTYGCVLVQCILFFTVYLSITQV